MDNKEKSPKFSDVLGALVNSVAYGRKVADIGALHIARSYYKNEYLRGLPIPRLRIDKVSISLPLMLSEVIEGKPAEPNEPKEIAKKVIEAFNKAINNEITNIEALKIHNEDENLLEIQGKALNIYKEFIEAWEHNCPQYEGKKRKEIFEEKLCKKIQDSFNDLERNGGDVKPSDILIMDAAGQAAEKVLGDLMEELFLELQRKQNEQNSENLNKIKLGKRTIELRTEVLKKAMNENKLDFETAFRLLTILSKVTFEGSVKRQAEEVSQFCAKWDEKIQEAEDEGKISKELATELRREARLVQSDGGIRRTPRKINDYGENWVKDTLKELQNGDYTGRLILSVIDAAENAAIKTATVGPDFCVVVNTQDIKNTGGGPEVVTRLNLVLHEEGLEWLSEKYDGKETTKLMPE